MRNLNLVYSAITIGIYIQDIDGNLYSESEWDGTKTANGIAVITENCSFVVAKESSSEIYAMGVSDSHPAPVTYASTAEEGLQLFDGKSNTEAMYAEDPTYYKAAAACHETILGNGLNGYLPALGEFGIVINNFNKIIALSDKIGSILRNIVNGFAGGFFWATSTGMSVDRFWLVEFIQEANSIFAVDYNENTEAPILICSPFVSPSDYITFYINNVEYKAVKGTTFGNWRGCALNKDSLAWAFIDNIKAVGVYTILKYSAIGVSEVVLLDDITNGNVSSSLIRSTDEIVSNGRYSITSLTVN